MALELSLESAQDLIQERHPEQKNILSLFSAPLNQLNQKQLEEARLLLLDSLFSEEGDDSAIAYEHYHLPVLIASADAPETPILLEAWSRSALYMTYNLVLLASDNRSAGALDIDFAECPEARSHLCVRSLDQAQTQLLLEGVSTYLPSQEPHLYLALQPQEPQLIEAMANGFLGLSLYPRLGLEDGHNGFLLEAAHAGLNARTLAYQLIDVLEEGDGDWEMLQDIAARGQRTARREIHV